MTSALGDWNNTLSLQSLCPLRFPWWRATAWHIYICEIGLETVNFCGERAFLSRYPPSAKYRRGNHGLALNRFQEKTARQLKAIMRKEIFVSHKSSSNFARPLYNLRGLREECARHGKMQSRLLLLNSCVQENLFKHIQKVDSDR